MTLPKTTCHVCGVPITLQARQNASEKWACNTCFSLTTAEREKLIRARGIVCCLCKRDSERARHSACLCSCHAAPATPSPWVFSFGYGQKHPVTGEVLGNRFVEIAAPDREAARDEMLARFGNRWAFQYTDRREAQCERFELRPLEGDAALGKLAPGAVVLVAKFCRECGEAECGTNPDRGGLCHLCADVAERASLEADHDARERDLTSSQDPESHRGPDGVIGNDFRDGSDS